MMAKLDMRLNEKKFIPQPLPKQISEILTEAILEGTLKPGTQLLEMELQQQFGVSRSPLREAFRDLENMGLVVIIPRRGTFVREVTLKDIIENYSVRANLEGLAAQLAHGKISGSELERMEQALEGIKKASHDKDRKAYHSFHEDFHKIFIKASGNSLLINLLGNLRMNRLFYYMSYRVQKHGFQQIINEQHIEIYNAFRDEHFDKQVLEQLVRHHINGALDMLVSEINASESNNSARNAKTPAK